MCNKSTIFYMISCWIEIVQEFNEIIMCKFSGFNIPVIFGIGISDDLIVQI